MLSITPISLRLIDCGNEFTLDNWKNVKYPLPEERKKRAYAFEVELLNAEHLETNSLDVGDRVQLNISSKDGRKVALLKDHQRIPVDGQSTALQPSQIMTQTEEKQKRTLADPVDDNAWRKHQPEILRVNEYDEYVVQHVQIASDTLNSSLWVSLPHLENELLDYLQDITDRYSKVVSVRLEQLVAGDLVIAHFDDDLFYRSRVKAINRKSCALRLQLIDYGNIFVLNDITEVKMPADVDMRKLAYAFEVLIADTDIGQIQVCLRIMNQDNRQTLLF